MTYEKLKHFITEKMSPSHVYQPVAINQLLTRYKSELLEKDPIITGFNIGANCGEDAGQTIFHCHVHLIPRRTGDVDDSTGGVRAVIPEKANYKGVD